MRKVHLLNLVFAVPALFAAVIPVVLVHSDQVLEKTFLPRFMVTQALTLHFAHLLCTYM